MDHFNHRSGHLHAEDVDVATIADKVGTPTFVYSAATLTDHYQRFRAAFAPVDPLICFAVKSNANLSVLRLLGDLGAGMDVVSGGELHRALEAGIPAARCVYAGVGKTAPEIEAALRVGIGSINVESEQELETIVTVARHLDCVAPVSIRINPDVDPHTHRHTTTGTRETKFGIDADRVPGVFASVRDNPAVAATGLHVHLGSPIYETGPFVAGLKRMLELAERVEHDGGTIDRLDIGGGFAADYETGRAPDAATYAEAICPLLTDRARRGTKVILEPGRAIAANAGILLLQIVVRKTSGNKTFLVCNGGMNALLRPSHYDAFHFAWPTTVPPSLVPAIRTERPELQGLEVVDIVGPICETGDFLARDRSFPRCDRGDLIAIFATGAYGMTMASRYNAMPLPAEVLVDGSDFRVVRRRETVEDLLTHER